MKTILFLLVPFVAFGNVIITPNEVASTDISSNSVSVSAAMTSDGSLGGDIYLWYGEGDTLSDFQSVNISIYQGVTVSGLTISGSLSGLSANTQYSFRWALADSTGSIIYYSNQTSFVTISNSPPTDISLSSTLINEGLDTNTQVAILTTVDSDNDDGFIYNFVSGSGDTDNSVFNIVEDKLIALEVFDYENAQSYSIRIKSEDSSGGSIEKEFIITINDMDHENGTAFSSDLSNLDGWLIQDLDGDGENFTIFSGGGEDWGFEPGQLAGSQSDGRQPDNTLITPIITIPSGSTDIVYSMRVAAMNIDNFAEKFTVYVYDITTSDPFENTIYEETLDVGGSGSSKIINATINNNFAGKNIRIYVRHHDTADQQYLLVDDFQIAYESSLSVKDLSVIPLMLYPNPANSIVRIGGNDQYYIEIYNFIGQKLLEVNGNSIDISRLPNAVYIVKATNKTTNKQLTSKLIKN